MDYEFNGLPLHVLLVHFLVVVVLAVGLAVAVVQIGESGAHAIQTGSFTLNPR